MPHLFEPAASGRSKCRGCGRAIARDVYYEQGRFYPAGFVHIACRTAYFEGHDVLAQLLHFSPALGEEEREDLKRAYTADQRAAAI